MFDSRMHPLELVVQSGRTLRLHRRSHRFESCQAHFARLVNGLRRYPVTVEERVQASQWALPLLSNGSSEGLSPSALVI